MKCPSNGENCHVCTFDDSCVRVDVQRPRKTDRNTIEPGWLIEGTHAEHLGGSARDYSESSCCGRAPGSCPDCPLIATTAPLCRHDAEQSLSDMRAAFDRMDAQHLTANSAERKATPIATGVLDYFPLAMAAIARLSKRGNDKHNLGEPLHWAREKSTDHADCIARHLIERGTVEQESGELHEACLAWRALALLQLAEEKRLAIKPAGV
jgi:dATP/dGTP diphosphohydrolase